MNPLGNQGARRRGSAAFLGEDTGARWFYGEDSGTRLSEQARDEIEHGDEGAGHKGNSVDIAQRYAQSESDEYTEQAERMTREMERGGVQLGNARDKFVNDMAEQLRGRPIRPAPPQEEEDGQAAGIGKLRLYDKKGHDEFWSNPEELKRVGKLVRPKL